VYLSTMTWHFWVVGIKFQMVLLWWWIRRVVSFLHLQGNITMKYVIIIIHWHFFWSAYPVQNLFYLSLSSNMCSSCVCVYYFLLCFVYILSFGFPNDHLFDLFILKLSKKSYFHPYVSDVHTILSLIWPVFLLSYPAECSDFRFYHF
jgi:hypothetical protein